jgi:hypothetical protein
MDCSCAGVALSGEETVPADMPAARTTRQIAVIPIPKRALLLICFIPRSWDLIHESADATDNCIPVCHIRNSGCGKFEIPSMGEDVKNSRIHSQGSGWISQVEPTSESQRVPLLLFPRRAGKGRRVSAVVGRICVPSWFWFHLIRVICVICG